MPLDSVRGEPGPVPMVSELFRAHAEFVWSLLRRLGVPESDAEDVTQEVFLIVHRKLADFEPRAAHRTWLYGIALRAASDYRRSARVRREELAAAPPEASSPPAQEQAIERREGLAWLDEVLSELGHDKREVFVLYEIEQLTMREVAQILACPLQTAYSRLHAGRAHVQARARARARAQAQGSEG